MKSASIFRRVEFRFVLLLLIAQLLGCSWVEPHRDIYGAWRAEQFSLAGIGIPIAPNMEFEIGKATVGGSPVVVESYVREGDRITVHLKGSVSLIFVMEGKDVMSIEVPLIGKVRYSRVK